METPGLIKTICQDPQRKIGIVNYTDMVVYDRCKRLVAIRFGGYPETVQAMSDALGGGCLLQLQGLQSQLSLVCRLEGKPYRKITQTGLYGECLCYLQDDELQTTAENEDAVNRKLYIYSEDENRLFSELDRKLRVPLIPEFEAYFLSQIKERGLLEPLYVHSSHKKFYAWRMTEDTNALISILEEGLRKGEIQIPGARRDARRWTAQTVEQYLEQFKGPIAQRISKMFIPVYRPGDPRCPQLDRTAQYVRQQTGYSLLEAQLNASEAIVRQFQRDPLALLVADCGTGKSKIGATALYAYQHRPGTTNRGHFNVVLCPGHLVKKWVREIRESVPDGEAGVADSISDVDAMYRRYQTGGKDVYCILSKETAKLGYMRQPLLSWSPVKKGYVCPHCGGVQEIEALDSATYTLPTTALHYRREDNSNHKCFICGAPLWGACNPDKQTEWVRISGYGFVHRNAAGKYLSDDRLDGKTRQRIQEVAENPGGYFPYAGAYRRYPLSSYIRRRCQIDGLIIDELHQYSGESAQGDAMADLAGAARCTLAMTATLANGYVKGIFYLLYRLKASMMVRDHYEYRNPYAMCQEYGIIEKLYETDSERYNSTSNAKRRLVREKMLPGISPLIYTRYLLENAVYLSLDDMDRDLSDYEEIPMGFQLPQDAMDEYRRLEGEYRRIMRSDMKIGMRIQSAALNLLTAYPDQPYGEPPILHPKDKEPVIIPCETGKPEQIFPKDQAVLDIVSRKVRAGERVVVYISWTRLDTRRRLLALLQQQGYRCKSLDKSVPTVKREEWIASQVEAGVEVLLVNPAVVETGLDLIAFTCFIFYDLSYNLYTFRQAARRGWRINQTAPLVQVYILYYKGTVQQRALTLMASKLAAATTLEGRISTEGLAALSDCQDLAAQLARDLVSNLQPIAEDLTEKFRRFSKKKAVSLQAVSKENTAPAVQLHNRTEVFADESIGQMQLFDLLAS